MIINHYGCLLVNMPAKPGNIWIHFQVRYFCLIFAPEGLKDIISGLLHILAAKKNWQQCKPSSDLFTDILNYLDGLE